MPIGLFDKARNRREATATYHVQNDAEHSKPEMGDPNSKSNCDPQQNADTEAREFQHCDPRHRHRHDCGYVTSHSHYERGGSDVSGHYLQIATPRSPPERLLGVFGLVSNKKVRIPSRGNNLRADEAVLTKLSSDILLTSVWHDVFERGDGWLS